MAQEFGLVMKRYQPARLTMGRWWNFRNRRYCKSVRMTPDQIDHLADVMYADEETLAYMSLPEGGVVYIDRPDLKTFFRFVQVEEYGEPVTIVTGIADRDFMGFGVVPQGNGGGILGFGILGGGGS